MIVVSDTSPLRYLVVLGRADILGDLFGEVACPPRVLEAASKGWLDFDTVANELITTTNFRVSDAVLAQIRANLDG